MDKSLFVEIEGLEVISGDAVLGSEVVPAVDQKALPPCLWGLAWLN